MDYRALNLITKPNNTPIPHPDEMFDQLGPSKFFQKLDLKTCFHQIRDQPEDIEKTYFNTKYGHFEYFIMPMGLCNAPATFQTIMNEMFYDCIDVFVVVYMEDLLVYIKKEREHLKHLETVLSRFKMEQLFISRYKCSLMKDQTEFLGIIVGKSRIKVDEDKVKVVADWPKPVNVSEVRGFIGQLQFSRWFIKDFSKIAAPLTTLTNKVQGIQK